MSVCMICPRECGVNRAVERGFCGAGEYPNIARAALHFWEEPCISGSRGSGAIFFCGCNLHCLFCQNFKISRHRMTGKETDAKALAAIMLSLEKKGAHNINLVSPAPFVPLLCEAIPLARKKGLKIPVVYNTNAYEKVETIKMLTGLVDIYLPDLKYVTMLIADQYSGAVDYFRYASKAIEEMFAQRGMLATNEYGIAKSGVMIRHLVLPGSVDETRRVIDYLADHYPPDISFSLMGQYVPNGEQLPAPLNRKLLIREYNRAIEYALHRGMQNVLIQKLSSASLEYTPVFDGSVI